MEITSNSLQELINKKAEIKARSFVNNLAETINKSGLLEVEGFQIKSGEGYNESMRSSLWSFSTSHKSSPYYQLYLVKLKQFTEEETKSFVSKVESLVEQTDTLLNIAENY